MEWWEVVTLVAGVVAALGTVAGLIHAWWTTERSEAQIETRENDSEVTVMFFASGPKPLHMPRVEIQMPNRIPITTFRERHVLASSDEPIAVTIPIRSAEERAGLVAAIQWTEHGRREPKLRGLRYGRDNHVDVWHPRKSWVRLSKRRMQKFRGRYSQM